jgi:uncharacterized protein (TIGR02588 family)
MAQSPRSKTPAKTPAKRAPAAPKRAAPARTPWLEWASAGVGLALILAILGLVGSELFSADETPPRFVVRATGVQPVPGGFHVAIEVRNEGGSPASSIVVEGELTPPSGPTETAEATFDFVADHSARDGGLYFTADPRQGDLALRAKGYAAP